LLEQQGCTSGGFWSELQRTISTRGLSKPPAKNYGDVPVLPTTMWTKILVLVLILAAVAFMLYRWRSLLRQNAALEEELRLIMPYTTGSLQPPPVPVAPAPPVPGAPAPPVTHASNQVNTALPDEMPASEIGPEELAQILLMHPAEQMLSTVVLSGSQAEPPFEQIDKIEEVHEPPSNDQSSKPSQPTLQTSISQPAPTPVVTAPVMAEPAPTPAVAEPPAVAELAPTPVVTEPPAVAEPAPTPAVTEPPVVAEPAPTPAVAEPPVVTEPDLPRLKRTRRTRKN
jgi:hypothetical protein